MRKTVTFLLLVIFGFSADFLFAQNDRGDRIGFGLGPSKIYGDNTGIHRKFKFKILPAATIDYSKKINAFWDIRGSLGWQMLNTGDFYKERAIEKIAAQNLPHAFKGNAIMADIVPIFHINPNRSGFLPNEYKGYIGTGLGIIHVNRTEKRLVGSELSRRIETSKATTTTAYIPVRVGISKELDQDWEIALEPSVMLSPFGQIDGNDQRQKISKWDMLFQLQFFVRKNLY